MIIEEGKFYKTTCGQKVGPMAKWWPAAEHKWEQLGSSNTFDRGGDIWRDDSTSDYAVPTLIAEWQ